jgi:hypothetical protein
MSFKINFKKAELNNAEVTAETTVSMDVPAVNETTKNEEMVTMTTTTIEVNAIEMVKAAGLTDAGEIRLFAMENRAITVPVLESALDELMVAYKKKATKLVKADLFARAIEMDLGTEDFMEEMESMRGPVSEEVNVDGVIGTLATTEEPATSETLVAEENNTEEEVTMTNTVPAQPKEVLERNAKALEKSPILKKSANTIHVSDHGYVNPAIKAMEDYLLTAAHKYNRALGEYAVIVEGIEWFGPRDRRNRYGRIGAVTIRMPRGYASISQWEKEEGAEKGKFVWYDFADFDYDQTARNQRFLPLVEGSGRLTLAIKEDGFENGLFIRMPKSAGKEEGTFFDIIKTSDIRWGAPHSDNNRNLEAALSAFVRVFTSEFVKGNPKNRHDLSPSCLTCRYAQILSTKDGVNDDLEHDKSNRVLQQNDIPTLVAWGERTPVVYCPVFNQMKDFDMILDANKADAQELEMVWDSELGQERYLRKGELYIDGRIIKSEDLRYEATKEAAEECDHYHGNVHKGEKRAAADRIATGNPYLSAYWTDRAEVNRQVVQTLINGSWVNHFPGQVEEPEAFRVVGLGGVSIYGTADVMAAANGEFVPGREEFDAVRADLMNKVNQIFYAAFNFGKLSGAQADMVFTMAANKPEIEDKLISRKWDSAMNYLAQTVTRITEGEKIKARPTFAVRFIEGAKPAGAEGVEINTSLLLDETQWRDEKGLLQTDFAGNSLGYKDLVVNPKEAVKFLDEVAAEDLVWDVLLDDTTYYVKSKSPKDKAIVVGALQEVLQRRVDNFLYDVRREENPGHALANFKVSETVKEYISAVLGLQQK